MYHFFVEQKQIGSTHIQIIGSDVNHIKNVLRMRLEEHLEVSSSTGERYRGSVEQMENDCITVRIIEKLEQETELPAKIYLFQGMPKSDKMEWIIQKSVELGVYEIVPVITKRTVVKYDKKKAEAKIRRWQSIAESAAKQSKRGVIPQIHSILSFEEALCYMKELDYTCIAYEDEKGMKSVDKFIRKLTPGSSAAVFIGPEGGFECIEIQAAQAQDIVPVSLGQRILRTETAGIALLSIMMYHLECESWKE